MVQATPAQVQPSLAPWLRDLAACGDDGDGLMLALALKIVNGDEDEAETVEAVFAAAREAETDAKEYLVYDG